MNYPFVSVNLWIDRNYTLDFEGCWTVGHKFENMTEKDFYSHCHVKN